MDSRELLIESYFILSLCHPQFHNFAHAQKTCTPENWCESGMGIMGWTII